MERRGRRLLQVRLTDRARDGWEKAAISEGATLTALLEALGEGLASGRRLPVDAVKRARQIDRERHSRN